MRRRRPFSALLCAVFLLFVSIAGAETKLLRFPDIREDKVVFTYGGDLWLASTSGGIARRLTAHPGVEYFAKFSPDGKWIAFTGQYDGDEQVYVIPAEGGVPKQLTWYPARGPLAPRHGLDNQVYGWTPDSKAVLFRSMHDDWHVNRLLTVPVDGGLPEPLPMPKSGAGDLSPDGTKIVYTPQFRDFRPEKRYEGGWAEHLYIFDLKTPGKVEQITNHVRSDRDPMWIGAKIYFSSDRDGTLNLYAYDIASRKLSQLTHSRKWDVRWPSSDSRGQIVYESGGELHVLETAGGRERAISITVPDDGLNTRPAWISAARNVEGFALSPKGERALFAARGEIFTVPAEKGATRNITNTAGAHEKAARWSPDGRKIAFISDRTGEEEIYVTDYDGGKPVQITQNGTCMRYAPEWAGDGRRLATADKDGRLLVIDVATREAREVARSERGPIRDYAWSHDGGHLAFSMNEANNFRAVYVWSVADGKLHKITDNLFTAFGPAWDPEGTYLYYLSTREFAPLIGSFEFNYALNRSTGIFGLALRKDVKNVFPPQNDDVNVEPEAGKKADAAAPDGDQKPEAADKVAEKKPKEYIKIDFDGLAGRVVRVPVEADNYGGLAAIKGHLVYLRRGGFYYGREGEPSSLRIFSIKDRKETVIAEKVSGWEVSADGNKVLVASGPDYKLYGLPVKPGATPKPVSTADLKVERVPALEWAEIFDEVWRRYRDFFYVPNMHGYDWKALHDQYKPLVQYVAHRSDLTYVMTEMLSELTVQHAYLTGGDYVSPERPGVALPGARFFLDKPSNRYRIGKIYRGQNEEQIYRSPLTEVGVHAQEGDFVLAIDGEELLGADSPYRLLRHKADRPVELTLNDKPQMEGSRRVTFRPISDESKLMYLEWVTTNRQKVAEMTQNRVGYIHVPDMSADGIREFIKYYYAQIRGKEGLVVDVRANGGGNVSQMLIERLRRSLLAVNFSRGINEPGTYPGATFYGQMVCLLDENSASDGDIFPYMFRQAGLGRLIGKRSWGGVVGITDHGPLLDGGGVNVPQFALASVDGKYVIEGHGVDPDIEVEDDPASVIQGQDPQLERGVAEVLKRMAASPKKLPARPPDPVKTPARPKTTE